MLVVVVVATVVETLKESPQRHPSLVLILIKIFSLDILYLYMIYYTFNENVKECKTDTFSWKSITNVAF